MTTRTISIIVAVIVLAALGAVLVLKSLPRSALPDAKPFSNDTVRIFTPLPDALVRSPLQVRGEARGTWYFEASFPIRVLAADGTELGVTPAESESDWMTTEFVPFSATVAFAEPATATGFLVLEKDNPSGLPEHADSVRIPVRFR